MGNMDGSVWYGGCGLIEIEERVVKIVGPIIEIKVKEEKCEMSKYDTFSIMKNNVWMMFGCNKSLKSKKTMSIYHQIKTKKGMVIMNVLKNYKNCICCEIHEMNHMGFLKNLCLRDSSFLKIPEMGTATAAAVQRVAARNIGEWKNKNIWAWT